MTRGSLAIGIIVVIIVVVAWARRQISLRATLLRPFDEQMTDVAAWAVKSARDKHGIELDYSVTTLGTVERILGELHHQSRSGQLAEEDVNRLGFRWGAYLGEVAKRIRAGCRWERDSAASGIVRESYELGWQREPRRKVGSA